MQRDIEIIVNNSEITAGTRGASLGPSAILTAARKQKNKLFGTYPIHVLKDYNHQLDQCHSTPFAKRIDTFKLVFQTIADKTHDLLKANRFPLVLAGDHGSAAGTIAGIKAAYPDKRLGVIWIDAHGDLHSPYTTPSGNMHGMPLALFLGEDNKEFKRNELDQHTIDSWDELKAATSGIQKLLPTDLVFIAVRDTEKEEDAIIERYSITNHSVEVVRSRGAKEIAELALGQLKDCDQIYISFDVDSMDPDVTSYGTGTPVKNGLLPEEATEILSILVSDSKTICLEIVEVNPCLDDKINKMAETTFSIIEKVIKSI
jgi:arginase